MCVVLWIILNLYMNPIGSNKNKVTLQISKAKNNFKNDSTLVFSHCMLTLSSRDESLRKFAFLPEQTEVVISRVLRFKGFAYLGAQGAAKFKVHGIGIRPVVAHIKTFGDTSQDGFRRLDAVLKYGYCSRACSCVG